MLAAPRSEGGSSASAPLSSSSVIPFRGDHCRGPYCSEIFPLNVRASAVSMSTAANWIGGAVMTEVVKLFPYLNVNGVFFLFAGLAVCYGVFIYFFCPETKGIQLEDVEGLFNHGYSTSTSPSFVEVKTPVENRKSAVAMA
ncbi:hypothetical protein PR001_g24140 [Phytophthora rubi]|uniref:Major facilitator superfamily (MFS) profile domain-containing protein n=1 Tax=Phytophthora rubi TaxID=129364 RepID=A0A6A3IG60_9STRA|nr:hypothetical protein PR001_g24140 [Phytophthora rubi]